MLVIPARVIATCFALAGFAAATVFGVIAGNPTSTILWRAVSVMGAGLLIGHVIGHVTQRTIDDYVDRYKTQRPIPDTDNPSPETTGQTADAAVAPGRSRT